MRGLACGSVVSFNSTTNRRLTIDQFFTEVYFFFHDLDNLRTYLKDLWQKYQDGEVDLVVSIERFPSSSNANSKIHRACP